jgi:hypothetical protein
MNYSMALSLGKKAGLARKTLISVDFTALASTIGQGTDHSGAIRNKSPAGGGVSVIAF